MSRILSIAFILCSTIATAQKFTISGYVTDKETGETILNAQIWHSELGIATVSNNYGFYTLTFENGVHQINAGSLGYSEQSIKVSLFKDLEYNIELSPSSTVLHEVEVNAASPLNVEEQGQMSKIEVPIKSIQDLPAVMGESDLMKALQYLPGAQSGSEGMSGLYVRGGAPDQNLILLDGVSLYSVNHLFGFFSVFNTDAISNVSLTKGGFPARYGGRLSSVIEVKMKDGNMKDFHGDWTSSIIASKITLEGPIVKDKSSFMISGRRTYLDALASPVIAYLNTSDEGTSVTPTFFFYDVNAKANFKLTKKDRVYLSHFHGKDDFGFRSEEKYDPYYSVLDLGVDWQNSISAVRWNHLWSGKLFSNLTLTKSTYNFNSQVENIDQLLPNAPDTTGQLTSHFKGVYLSGIEDYGAKFEFDFVPIPSHYIKWGAGWTNHTFSPGAINYEYTGTTGLDTSVGAKPVYSNECFVFVEDQWRIGKHIRVNGGLHGAAYIVENSTYSSIQPRLGLNIKLPGKRSVKASYAEMMQFVNLLTNEGIGLPTDLWVPATARLLPQESQQLALGFAQSTRLFEFTAESYYKEMENLVSYKEGASFIFSMDQDWEDKITQGKGAAYGLELFARRKSGKTTGWIGYTLAWNFREFEEINNGQRYFHTYDRRHDISLVLNHKLSQKIKLSAIWVYSTGRAVTLPEYRYYAGLPTTSNRWSLYFLQESAEEKNSFRMSPYHRLDLSITYKLGSSKTEADQWWSLSLYNAYNNLNPFFMETGRDNNGNIVFKEYGLFPFIPSFSYRRKF
jgi:hypothetical protein